MLSTLIHLLRAGTATQREMFPALPAWNRGLPRLADPPCNANDGCRACVDSCPADAIAVIPEPDGGRVSLDRGRCIACGACTEICPTGTIREDRSTTVAAGTRSELVLTNKPPESLAATSSAGNPFRRSIHIREVSTGDNASDLEVAAANNPIFDSSRFGIHFVASPRFADALLVTGPVARAMHAPLLRCFDAMAEPRLVIAAGSSAISGGLHRDSYAGATGVDAHLPVAVYVPGNPPHPWYVIHGILLAMRHPHAIRMSLRSIGAREQPSRS